MKLIILGSGSCVPSKRRAPSGYLLESGDDKILLDGGSGTLQQIAKAGINSSSIQTVMYTHFHVDHTAELLPLLFARKHDPSPLLSKKLNIYGPEGMLEHIIRLDGFAGSWVYKDNDSITIKELKANDEIVFGSCKIACHSTYHQTNSIGYRFTSDNGEIFSYTGDTGRGDRLLPLLQDADIAVAECSFPDSSKVKGHMTPIEIAQIAESANVKKLLLTHLYPEMDSIDPISVINEYFKGIVELAEDLNEYQI